MERQFYVYILASRRNGTLYTGVTGRIVARVSQHRQKLTPGFTSRYGIDLLVWYEPHENIEVAIRREKRLKKWLRAWKVALIEQTNPLWLDLFPEFFAPAPGPLTGIRTYPAPDPRCSPPSPL